MMVKTDIKIIFKDKTFVFDSGNELFSVRGTLLTRDEWLAMKMPRYDAYIDPNDKENNPVTKKVVEAGGIVRTAVSGKTDYYVVSSPGKSPSMDQKYAEQVAKGKPVVAVSLKILKEQLGIKDEPKTTKPSRFEFYTPTNNVEKKVFGEDIKVEEKRITGKECEEWCFGRKDDDPRLYIYDYIGNNDEITIPVSVEEEKVYIPKEWEGGVFSKSKAKAIKIPGAFKKLERNFLSNNKYLEKIYFGNGIIEIGFSTCNGCENLKEVHLPSTLQNIGSDCFWDTPWFAAQGDEVIAGSNLLKKRYSENDSSTYTVPDGITCIASYVFNNEYDDRTYPIYIHNIVLPETLRYLSDNAFHWGAKDIEWMKIPTGVVRYGYNSLGGIQAARDMQWETNEMFFIVDGCLLGIYGVRDYIKIPDTVKRIEKGNRLSCTNFRSSFYFEEPIKTIEFPKSVIEVGDYFFHLYKSVEKIILYEGIKKLGEGCFCDCRSLKDINIPDSVEEIGADAFKYCENVTLHVKKGSYAEKYAIDNNVKYTIV